MLHSAFCILHSSTAGTLRPAAVLLLLAGLACAAGCGDSQKSFSLDAAVKKVFEPRRTPQQYMLIAVSDADSDVRREAVARVARSNQADRDWAVRGFVAIALLEDDPHARGVAIRGLVQTADERAADTCLKILNHKDEPAAEVREPGDVVRWEATAALSELALRGDIPDGLRPRTRETLLTLLSSDSYRHVRLAAARGLGAFPDTEVLEALIEGLRDEDFAVVHECEGALVRLTGLTHHCNALDWEQWAEANRGRHFDGAGQVPESRRPPYDGPVGKFAHDTRQAVQWLWPGKKE